MSLPKDILHIIFSYIDPQQYGTLLVVCKKWKKLIEERERLLRFPDQLIRQPSVYDLRIVQYFYR